ncbi:unnamed protein product, partial [Rotaria sordida]
MYLNWIDYGVIALLLSVNLYGPSLALSQVTGLNLWLTIGACGLICTLYTSIGGMKAVIWTDVIQSIIMFLGVILSIVFGFMDSGGVRKVFEIASAGDRLNLPRVAWLSYAFVIMTLLLSSLVALILYAKYSQCDPFRAKIIKKPDQIYPFFVIQTFGRYPGFTGLFIGSVLSASLSTVSSGINSITTVILEDIYKRISIFPSISGEKEALISKILSSIFGILTTLIAFLMSYFENNISVIVYQVVGSLTPPILSVFLLGFFAPSIYPFFVIQTFGRYPGFTGLFIGSVLSASLSTVSSGINSITTVILEDIYKRISIFSSISGEREALISKILCLLGILVFGSNDPKSIDKSLLCTWKDAFGCGSSIQTKNQLMKVKNTDIELENLPVERQEL